MIVYIQLRLKEKGKVSIGHCLIRRFFGWIRGLNNGPGRRNTMDWFKLMENFIYNTLFFMAISFLYIILGFDVAVITLLSLIYFKIGFKDE